ncbi:MAG: aldehyde dehydrogenase family protein [Burkholderiaceae bacterium]
MNLTKNYIAGDWVDGADAAENINPSDTRDLFGTYARASLAQATDAVAAAQAALTPQQRADALDTVCHEIQARKAELSDLLAREEGKALADRRELKTVRHAVRDVRVHPVAPPMGCPPIAAIVEKTCCAVSQLRVPANRRDPVLHGAQAQRMLAERRRDHSQLERRQFLEPAPGHAWSRARGKTEVLEQGLENEAIGLCHSLQPEAEPLARVRCGHPRQPRHWIQRRG